MYLQSISDHWHLNFHSLCITVHVIQSCIFWYNVFFPQETGKCEATFDFDGDEGAGELRFTTGEVIETIEWVNEEWMSGRIGSREGIFPTVFVKVIKELPKQGNCMYNVMH